MSKEIRKAVAYLRTSSRTNVGADKDSDNYVRERSFGDVELTRAEFRQILRARNAGRDAEADALIGDKILQSRPDLLTAPGIRTSGIEIVDVDSGEVE
jgi:hypothetical protein